MNVLEKLLAISQSVDIATAAHLQSYENKFALACVPEKKGRQKLSPPIYSVRAANYTKEVPTIYSAKYVCLYNIDIVAEYRGSRSAASPHINLA